MKDMKDMKRSDIFGLILVLVVGLVLVLGMIESGV